MNLKHNRFYLRRRIYKKKIQRTLGKAASGFVDLFSRDVEEIQPFSHEPEIHVDGAAQ